MMEMFRGIYRALRRGQEPAVAAIIRARGSTPRTSGSGLIIYPDGAISGTIGGAGLTNRGRLHRHDGKGGMREFLRGDENQARTIPVEDPFIRLDADTPQDLLRLKEMMPGSRFAAAAFDKSLGCLYRFNVRGGHVIFGTAAGKPPADQFLAVIFQVDLHLRKPCRRQ